MSTIPSFARRRPLATFFVLAFALAWLFRTLVARLLPVELPAPTRPYRVRRVSYDREDVTREDPYARKEGVKRELPVWIWYPAEPGAYLPGRGSTAGWIWGFDPNQVRAHALPEVPVATDRNNYPVLVFSPAGSSPHEGFRSCGWRSPPRRCAGVATSCEGSRACRSCSKSAVRRGELARYST